VRTSIRMAGLTQRLSLPRRNHTRPA
jgi:hypothetical protein